MSGPVTNLRVLHIDDNDVYRSALKNALEEEAGIVVMGCRDSREASGQLAEEDFDVLIVDSSGFEFAQQLRQGMRSPTLIVLSTCPEGAPFQADAEIAKSDTACTRVLEMLRTRSRGAISPMIALSQKAFEQDLTDLLKTHYREWVAYSGKNQIGFGRTQTALFEQCRRRGLAEDQFVVRSIEPPLADEDLVFPAES